MVIKEQNKICENGEKEEKKRDKEVTSKGKEVMKPLPYPKSYSKKEKRCNS